MEIVHRGTLMNTNSKFFRSILLFVAAVLIASALGCRRDKDPVVNVLTEDDISGSVSIWTENSNNRYPHDKNISAVANDGYEFAYWSGDINGTFSSIYITDEEDGQTYDLEAHFKKSDKQLLIQTEGTAKAVHKLYIEIHLPDEINNEEILQGMVYYASHMLKKLNVETVTDKANSRDAALYITIEEAEALGAFYGTNNIGGYYYTGAHISGTARVEIDGVAISISSLEKTLNLSDAVYSSTASALEWTEPENAPFTQAFGCIFNDCLYEIYGPGIALLNLDYICDDCDFALTNQERLVGLGQDAVPYLLDGLENPDIEARLYAIDTLHQLGPSAQQAIPVLISVLKDDSYKFFRGDDISVPQQKIYNERHKTDLSSIDSRTWGTYVYDITAETLTSITGKDFGTDAQGWENWYYS